MSALSVRRPDSLHDRARELAAREGISISQLVATVLADPADRLPAKASNRLHLPAGAKRQARPKRKIRARRG